MMTKKEIDYFDFNNSNIFRGFPPSRLKRPENINDYEQIKIAGFSHIKKMIESNSTNDIPANYFKLETKHKKNYCYIQQYDIVIPALLATNKLPVLYIENAQEEKIIYNATVFVIRLKNTSLSKYLYIMLNSKSIQNNITKLAYREQAAISYRMTIDIIKSIKIPMMDKDKMKKIVIDYDKLQKQKIKIQEQERQFWQNIDTLEEIRNLI